MAYFFDSSAFAKLFVQETGTATAIRLYQASNDAQVSVLVSLEVRSALRRREAAGDISAADAQTAIGQLESELAHLEPLGISGQTLSIAHGLVDKHRLRALDALQLASALQAGSAIGNLIFVCSDTRLIRAAQAEGLIAMDPSVP